MLEKPTRETPLIDSGVTGSSVPLPDPLPPPSMS